MEGRGKRGQQEVKRIKLCYIHASTTHNEYNQYVQQTCSNKQRKTAFKVRIQKEKDHGPKNIKSTMHTIYISFSPLL